MDNSSRSTGSISEPEPFIIGRTEILPGQRRTVNLPLARLYTHTQLKMPVHVIHGRRSGPRLFVSAAVHGDEINGIEIVRRLLHTAVLDNLFGTLIAVPVVNVYGLINHSRYLPDRRDLNRAFPGSKKGSLAGRLASLFMREIVRQCTHGIDLHTGSNHRSNLPQIRANLNHEPTLRLAEAFGAPIIIHADTRDGSLREAAGEAGVSVLLYEAGEPMRFDEDAIDTGLQGILRIMHTLGMIAYHPPPPPNRPTVARRTTWLRAKISGIFQPHKPLGAAVQPGDTLGLLSDPFGSESRPLTTKFAGIIIGRRELPLVYRGDALIHIARTAKP